MIHSIVFRGSCNGCSCITQLWIAIPSSPSMERTYLSEQSTGAACWPVVFVAQARVDVDDSFALSVWCCAVHKNRRAGENGLVVVFGHL